MAKGLKCPSTYHPWEYTCVLGYALEKSSCIQPILQHTSTSYKHTGMQSMLWKAFSDILSIQQSRCKIYEGTRQTKYQNLIHVREERVDKSLHQNYRKIRMCVQSCHARKPFSRHASFHQAVGLACTAIRITMRLKTLSDLCTTKCQTTISVLV